MSQSAASANAQPGWLARNYAAIIRHGVIWFFMIVILLPLSWVLIMSVKSRPDAMRGDFWPRKFDFTTYAYVFQKIETLPINMWNSIYVTAATVLLTTACAVLAGYALVHMRPRFGGIVVAAGLEEETAPTWRILLERMCTDPGQFENAIYVNLHGELLPMPSIRNYSDPAKDPSEAGRRGVRVVTHPRISCHRCHKS